MMVSKIVNPPGAPYPLRVNGSNDAANVFTPATYDMKVGITWTSNITDASVSDSKAREVYGWGIPAWQRIINWENAHGASYSKASKAYLQGVGAFPDQPHHWRVGEILNDMVGRIDTSYGESPLPSLNPISSIEDFLNLLTSATLWLRVLEILIGLLALGVGLAHLSDNAGSVLRKIPIYGKAISS